MAIKHVGEIVDAWIRGHEVLCNACDCRDVCAPLYMTRGHGEDGIGSYIYQHIHHVNTETMAPMLYRLDDGPWMANTITGLEDFLNSITILKEQQC